MKRKTKSTEAKAENGSIKGYAATFIREPDSYGDIIAPGAFSDCIRRRYISRQTQASVAA